jgi:arsenite methyltransferase
MAQTKSKFVDSSDAEINQEKYMTDYLNRNYDWSQPEIVAGRDELPLWSAPFGMMLLKYIPFKVGMCVLDLGCGPGFPLVELAQRLGTGCLVIGLDPWREAMLRAAYKLHLWDVTNAMAVLGDGTTIPAGKRTFDLIVSNLGVNNFDNVPGTLDECRRVIKTGGSLALTTNLSGHMQEFYDIYAAALRETGHADLLERLQVHIDHRGTVESLSGKLVKAGFRIQRVERETFNMRFLNGSALLRHSFIIVGFLNNWRALLPEEIIPEVFARLEANLNTLARERGELSLTIPACYIEAATVDGHPAVL